MALILALFMATSLFAQQASEEFVNGQGRFGFKHGSSAPGAYRQVFEEFGSLSVYGDLFVWADEKRFVSAAHLVVWQKNVNTWTPNLPAAAKLQAINYYKKIYGDEFAKASATVQEVPFAQGESKGIEFVVTGESRSVARIFFHGNRLYLFVVKQKAENFDEQKKILDSFRSLSIDEYNAALIKDSEPAALEQNIPSGIRPTDAMEMGIKGNVKSIVEDIESGPIAKRRRLSHSVENFSRLGHLTRRITYFEGFVDSIANFGWVDGVRAVNLAPITHRAERTIITRRAALVGSGAPEGYNRIMQAPDGTYRDFRYTAKFESKYDDQWLLTERREIANSGDVNYIEKIVTTKAGRDIKTQDNSGGFLSRRFEVIDKDGNISEVRTLDDRGGVQSTIRYQYEFDDKGNWIVRRSFNVLRGRSTPSDIHYRKIEYHERSDLDARPTNEVITF